MAGNKDELQVGVRFQQAPVNAEDNRFLPLMGAAGDPYFLVLRKIEPGCDVLLQTRRGGGRQTVVFGVPLDVYLIRREAHGDNPVPVGPGNDPDLVEFLQHRFPEKPCSGITFERTG